MGNIVSIKRDPDIESLLTELMRINQETGLEAILIATIDSEGGIGGSYSFNGASTGPALALKADALKTELMTHMGFLPKVPEQDD